MFRKKAKTPAIITFQHHWDAYSILGVEDKKCDPLKDPQGGACWDKFFRAQADENFAPLLKDRPLFGVFCVSEPGHWSFLVGATVENIEEAPEGLCLRAFPASEYLIVTHEWVSTTKESDTQINRVVDYAHGSDCMLPEGYERYSDPMLFTECFNWNFDDKQFRFEVWLPIRQAA